MDNTDMTDMTHRYDEVPPLDEWGEEYESDIAAHWDVTCDYDERDDWEHWD